MNIQGAILVLPEKEDAERDAVEVAWLRNGGQTLRLGRFWDPPAHLMTAQVRVYGSDSFCLVLAQKLGLMLVSPPDDLIAKISRRWLKRDVAIMTLAEARAGAFPCFIKPLVPKLFKAAVYADVSALDAACTNVSATEGVIVSAVVAFEAEVRAFVLDGTVLDCAFYEGDGDNGAVADFVGQLCADVRLPKTCVVDAGFVPNSGWVFIEANASWGAGLNGCNAEKVLPAIEAATTGR